MTNISKDLRAELAEQIHHRPAGDRRRADLAGRHPQMADPLSRARRRQAGRDRDRLHSRGRPRHAVRLQPGRLHADLLLLPHRHAEAGAQPDGRGNPRADCWSPATGSATSPTRDTPQGAIVPAEGRKVSNIVMMGMGEPLYNFDDVKRRAADRHRRRRPCPCPSAASRFRPPASCRSFGRTGEEIGVHAGDLAARRHATNCATMLVPINKKYPLEGTDRRPAATIPACPMPAASPSNM